MTYVPVTHSAPPSPRARELGSRLEEVIQIFRTENPGLSNLEIRQAMTLATKDMKANIQVVLIAISVGLVLTGILAFFFVSRQGRFDVQILILPIIAAVGIFLVILTTILRNR